MDKPARREIMPGVFLTTAKTHKFKTGYMSITLLRPLEKTTAAVNALLPNVLRRGTAAYPDMESLSAALDELYGARVSVEVRKKGEVQCIGFSADFIDDIYVGQDELLEKVTELLGQILINPATRGGRFIHDYVESERYNLCQKISTQINDKRQYSMLRLVQIMCTGEPYGADRLGSLNSAESITGSRLFRNYSEVLAHSRIEVFYCGSAERQRVEFALMNALGGLPSGTKAEILTSDNQAPETPVFKSEELDVAQCNLTMGFRTGCRMTDDDYPALMLFNALFGGTTASRLFLNVRERMSLCYYAGSTLEKHKGLLFVSAGIQEEKFDAANAEILHQLDSLKNGEIEDDELESARQSIINSVTAVSDSQAQLEDYYLSSAIEQAEADTSQLLAELKRLDKDDVARAANGITLDTTYFLKGVSK